MVERAARASAADDPIVAMCEFQGRLYVARTRSVWCLENDGKLHQVIFVDPVESVGFGT
jgi:hypothetical protein